MWNIKAVTIAATLLLLPTVGSAGSLYEDAPVFPLTPLGCEGFFYDAPGFPTNKTHPITMTDRPGVRYAPFESTTDVRFLKEGPADEITGVEIHFNKSGSYSIGLEGFGRYAQSKGFPPEEDIPYVFLKNQSLPFVDLLTQLGDRATIYGFMGPDFIVWGLQDVKRDGRTQKCTWYRTNFIDINFFDKIENRPYLGS